MIQDHDRSGWFGASDTKFIMADNRNTKTWKSWWSVKSGLMEPEFTGSIYTRAGNMFEHHILRAIDPDMTLDGQIIMEKYLLRVNYDGYRDGKIVEIKTHKNEKEFSMIPAYWQQCQVEMYVYQQMSKKWFLPDFEGLYLVSYALRPDEYYLDEDEIEVDPDRIILHPVEYDKAFIKGEYLPRLKELARALKKGKYPYKAKNEAYKHEKSKSTTDTHER